MDYKLGDILSTGATATVRKITINGTLYAAKIMSRADRSESDVLREVKIHKALRHPHIVPFIQYFADPTQHYIVMALAANELFYFIEPGIGLEGAHSYFRQLMQAVWHIHKLGICHRDIKPENILLDSDGTLLLTDFGHSTVFRTRAGDRRLRKRAGSVVYMAPEIITGRYAGDQVDIWSAGVVLFVMCTGMKPWDEPVVSDKRFRKYVDKEMQDYPPWCDLEAELRHLIEGMCRLEGRYTRAEIESNEWFARQSNRVVATKYKTYSASQPLPCKVPYECDVRSQPLFSGLRRFWVDGGAHLVISNIVWVLRRKKVKHLVRKSSVWFCARDEKQMEIAGEFYVLGKGNMSEVCINRLKGDCLEFKRFCNNVFDVLNDLGSSE